MSWEQFLRLANELDRLRVSLLNGGPVINLVHQALDRPGQRGAAFELIGHLSTKEKEDLLPALVDLACFSNKYRTDAFLAICSLPRRWVVANIEPQAELIFSRASEEEFGLLLHLLFEVSPELGRTIAERGLHHHNEDIKHIAATFLSEVQ